MRTLNCNPGAKLHQFLSIILVTFLLPLLLMVTLQARGAGDATWSATPVSGDWNTPANWVPAIVPDGSRATATFATSNTTEVSISTVGNVNDIIFEAGASPFTITATPMSSLDIHGAGIQNNSGIVQNFVTATDGSGHYGEMDFRNSASAGACTITNEGASFPTVGGELIFYGKTAAGTSIVVNNGGKVAGAFGGFTEFDQSSSASDAYFVINGGTVAGAFGGGLDFFDSARADRGTFVINGGPATLTQGGGAVLFQGRSSGGYGRFVVHGAADSGENGGSVSFEGTSTAENAILLALGGLEGGGGGTIGFAQASAGGTARIEVFDNGTLNISSHDPGSVSVGSIEGSGLVLLGGLNLIVGKNNLSTTFSGAIEDSGIGGVGGGSLTKIGAGTLTLSGAGSSYQGGTILRGGSLLLGGGHDAATVGTGSVQVDGGTLGGGGLIIGTVTMGNGTGERAYLSPGETGPGALAIGQTLTFQPDSTYKFKVDSTKANSDRVAAAGVTINGGTFSFTDLGGGTLPAGTVFTAIKNTSLTPIVGTFTNLPDGAILAVNANKFQASYEGGDGNDLTLTVQ